MNARLSLGPLRIGERSGSRQDNHFDIGGQPRYGTGMKQLPQLEPALTQEESIREHEDLALMGEIGSRMASVMIARLITVVQRQQEHILALFKLNGISLEVAELQDAEIAPHSDRLDAQHDFAKDLDDEMEMLTTIASAHNACIQALEDRTDKLRKEVTDLHDFLRV